MDILTHGLTASMLLLTLDARASLLFGILGSTILDMDILLTLLPIRDPRLYMFTHGGITHSLMGGCLAALGSLGAAMCIKGCVPALPMPEIPFSSEALFFVLIGVFLHLSLDLLAYPGIPLLYPISDRKYTLGIFPGPSIILLVISLVFLLFMLLGVADLRYYGLYGGSILLVLLIRAKIKVIAAVKTDGKTIPTLHPLRWLVIAETEAAYVVSSYHILRGTGEKTVFQKFEGVAEEEVERIRNVPALKRQYYHSYIVTVQKDGHSLLFRDPLREGGQIWYPPHFIRVRVGENGQIEG